MKIKSYKYFLQEIPESGSEITIKESDDKKAIFDLYDIVNEKNKTTRYKVVCQETSLETIAQSEDCRQSVFPF